MKKKVTMKYFVGNSIKFIFSVFLLLLLMNSNSHAYIDPGTGAFIIQSILAIIGSIVFYLGYPIRIIKNIYNKIFGRKKKDDK